MLRNFSYVLLCVSSLTCVANTSAAQDNDSFFDRLRPAGTETQSGKKDTSQLHQRIRDNKATPEEYLTLAASLRSAGNSEGAVGVLEKAQKKFPDNTDILKQFGIAMIDSGHPIEAVEVFDVLAAIEPQNAMAYNGKAVAFDTAGNHTAALEIYEKALSLAPDSVAIRNNMAMSYALNDQLDDAETLLEALFAQAPDIAKIRHNLALVYGLKGNTKRAMELNLQSLSQQQAEENLKFYQRYASLKEDYKPVDLMTQENLPLDDLFVETPEAPVVKNLTVSEEKYDASKEHVEKITDVSPSAGSSEDKSSRIANDSTESVQHTPATTSEDPAKTDFFGTDADYSFPTGRKN